MIGRRPSKPEAIEVAKPKGFDDFELRLGDIMRGERATLGKSLLDVQRELRIKAAYIAAIENCDPDAFDTPGFIAGYVRSYARYLNMDPDETFSDFCKESGFQVAHGMSAQASVIRKPQRAERFKSMDVLATPSIQFAPVRESPFAGIEAGAVGSVLVLLGLITAIGYGGWTVLQEVQRVQVVPVEQTPVVQSDIDPLGAAQGRFETSDASPTAPSYETAPGIEVSRSAALDRLYRPQALDVPVLVARDAPISTLDPQRSGAFAPDTDVGWRSPTLALAEPSLDIDLLTGTGGSTEQQASSNVPQVVESLGPNIRMVAAYPSWVRVQSAEGNTLFEGIMEPGDTYDIPAMEAPPRLRTGESGAIYFAMGTDCYGPVGARGEVTGNLPLDRVALLDSFNVVEPQDADSALNRMFADLAATNPTALPKLPCQTN